MIMQKGSKESDISTALGNDSFCFARVKRKKEGESAVPINDERPRNAYYKSMDV